MLVHPACCFPWLRFGAVCMTQGKPFHMSLDVTSAVGIREQPFELKRCVTRAAKRKLIKRLLMSGPQLHALSSTAAFGNTNQSRTRASRAHKMKMLRGETGVR